MLKDIDYRDYLSCDNGKGLLLSKDIVCVLDKYNFDYQKYSTLSNLIFDIDNYLNYCFDDIDDLENVLLELSEINYYLYTNK